MSDVNIPVVIGIGETIDRSADPSIGLEPLQLIRLALEKADEDAGGGFLRNIDSLDVVNVRSWPYANLANEISHAIGAAPRRAVHGPVGGESPVRYLHEAALRIARGESEVAVVVGAEAQSTVTKAERASIRLPWKTESPEEMPGSRAKDYLSARAIKLGVAMPVTVYPFYEVASADAWGQTPREAQEETGRLWERYAKVAAENPSAWTKGHHSADEITRLSDSNRLIAWPYSKLMVANPSVNMGAALLVTSLARARAAGVASDRMVHVWGGVAANERRDYMNRDQFSRSHAQDVVLEGALQIAGNRSFDTMELYSCFPCVPKMAFRTLGAAKDVAPTAIGGLTFFGAPLSNYMTHAICGIVRELRQGKRLGLVYGQGEFVTKHHAVILSSAPAGAPITDGREASQALCEARYGAVPPASTKTIGTATIETFTIIYRRDGSIASGVVILRTDDGRLLARVPANDEKTLSRLIDLDRSSIGLAGTLRPSHDDIPEWGAEL
jgi:acetyl-CoA C-acetyltransferase